MANHITVVTDRSLKELTATAKKSPRLRKNHNIHTTLEDPVQRLFNAMEPGTYVRPHRHRGQDRWEYFQIVTGAAMVLTFDASGRVMEKIELSDKGPNCAIEIPGDTWHTIVSLESGTVLFEIKQGPYKALTDKDFAHWAPLEGESTVGAVVDWFGHAAPGDSLKN